MRTNLQRRLAWGGCLVALVVVARGETLTVATYNLENYGLADRVTAAGYRKEYPKPEEEKRALRRAIGGLNADILAVQEIGTAPYVQELRRDLGHEGVDYPYAVLLEGADPDRHVAVLARRPIVAAVQHVNLRFPYFGGTEVVKRGLLEVHFNTDAGDLAVYVLHLKSRYTERPDDPQSDVRRTGEAVAVRDLILRRAPRPDQSRFVVLGDFNDERGSAPLERVLHRGALVVAQLLPVADSRGETWTYSFRKQDSYSRVDHILVSPALRPAVEHGRARIYDGDGVRKASDHRPVIVTLNLAARPK